MYLSVVFFVVMQVLSYELLPGWTSGIQSNGEAISKMEVAALLALCQVVAWSFLIGMHLYGRCYVVRVFISDGSDNKLYETIGWLTRRQWFVSGDEERACQFNEGKTAGHYDAKTGLTLMEVNAPYYSQRVSNRRLPFILDYDGYFFDDNTSQD